jgi:SAM-dependent methyltransferase
VLWLFLERETDLFERPGSLLHIAPEYALQQRLSRLPGLRYLSGDLDSPLADRELDVMDLPFEEGSFDFLICNHVLEHVADDRRALAEIHRVLAPGGWAILMCPVDGRRATTLEDPAAATPAERHRRFGQADHLRLYGRDYAVRLAEAGFEVRRERYVEACDSSSVARFGLLREGDEAFGEEDVFLCVKPEQRRPPRRADPQRRQGDDHARRRRGDHGAQRAREAAQVDPRPGQQAGVERQHEGRRDRSLADRHPLDPADPGGDRQAHDERRQPGQLHPDQGAGASHRDQQVVAELEHDAQRSEQRQPLQGDDGG